MTNLTRLSMTLPFRARDNSSMRPDDAKHPRCPACGDTEPVDVPPHFVRR